MSEPPADQNRCVTILASGERCTGYRHPGASTCAVHGGVTQLNNARRAGLTKPDRYGHLLKGPFLDEYRKQLDDPEQLDLSAELATQRVLLSGFLKMIGEVELEKLPAEALGALEQAINGIRETVKVIGQLEGKLAVQLTLTDVHFMNGLVVDAVNTALTRYIADPVQRDDILKAISDELGRVRVPTPARTL